MDVVYSLKRRWGTRVTLYTITGKSLNLDTGMKVLTKTSRVIPRAVFLPPKQARTILKKQAAFAPYDAVILIDKRDVRDFTIKLDDYVVKTNYNRYVIVEIEDHPHFYMLKTKAVGRIMEPQTVDDTLGFSQESDHAE